MFGKVTETLPILESAVNAHGDGVWKVFTTGLIYGLGAKSNIQYLPPAEILHDGVLIDFFEAFDNIWDRVDPETNQLYSTTISNTDKRAKASQLTSQLIKTKMREC